MNTVYIHIDEHLRAKKRVQLKRELMMLPYVHHIEIDAKSPHDLMVEFEEHHDVPMALLRRLQHHGLHPDILSC